MRYLMSLGRQRNERALLEPLDAGTRGILPVAYLGQCRTIVRRILQRRRNALFCRAAMG